MTDVYIRLSGAPEKILEKLIKEGYFKTKAEAMRAGIIQLGKEYSIIGTPAYYRQKLEERLGDKRMTPEETEKALQKLEE
jgi:Arc/MetJ-type ribon-helix-helix transcriptional regulator